MIDFYKANKDIIYVIGIHLLMPVVYMLISYGSGIMLFDFAPEEKFWIGFNTLIFLLLCICILILFILRILILPFLYGYFEKK